MNIKRKLVFTEMFRDTEQQTILWKKYEKNLEDGIKSLPADKPGESTHQCGCSFDVPLDRYSFDESQLRLSKALKIPGSSETGTTICRAVKIVGVPVATRTHEVSMITIKDKSAARRAEISLSHPGETGMGLIILRPTGIFYTHQTGGYTCYPSQEEGVYVPVQRELTDQETLLTDHFMGSKWNGWCSDGIDEATAEFVDYVLSTSYQTKYLRVDRMRLDDCKEAWVYVDVSEPTDEPDMAPISGFGKCKGVFLWTNSD